MAHFLKSKRLATNYKMYKTMESGVGPWVEP